MTLNASPMAKITKAPWFLKFINVETNYSKQTNSQILNFHFPWNFIMTKKFDFRRNLLLFRESFYSGLWKKMYHMKGISIGFQDILKHRLCSIWRKWTFYHFCIYWWNLKLCATLYNGKLIFADISNTQGNSKVERYFENYKR